MTHHDAPAGPLPAELFAERRRDVARRLAGGVLVLPGTPVRYRSRDTEYPHRPDSELYWLTGLEAPGTVAVLRSTGEPGDAEAELTVFAAAPDPDAERWTGPRPPLDEVGARSGADRVHAMGELAAELPALLDGTEAVYFRLGEHPHVEPLVVRALRHARARGPRTGSGPWQVTDPGRVLDDLRLRKHPAEVERLRRAVALTAEGFRAAARALVPGAGEWRVQAALEAAFRAGGGDGPAFEPIVASGPNACVLHYVGGRRRIEKGDLVLIDAGAAYGLMAGDLSRTFPVAGARFEGEPRAVYDIVERARQAAVDAVRPGAPIADVHRAAVTALTEGLVDLGVLDGEPAELVENEAYRPYYPHQTSHWLGLDVHDVGDYARWGVSRLLEPGMVLTVEPGLYLSAASLEGADGPARRFAGLGVRIEDDLLVTDEGHENLSAGLPTNPDEVAQQVG